MRRMEGIGADAHDLMAVYVWANAWAHPGVNLWAQLYRRYASASRITVPMVERFLGEIGADDELPEPLPVIVGGYAAIAAAEREESGA